MFLAAVDSKVRKSTWHQRRWHWPAPSDRDVAGAHGRQHVQHIGLHVVLDLELDVLVACIDRHGLVLARYSMIGP
jgi:hypothetical protein